MVVRLKSIKRRARQWRGRWTMFLLVYCAFMFGLLGVSIVARLMLLAVTPYGEIYPHSLLAAFQADYGAWDIPEVALAPLNPEAANAAERDATEVSDAQRKLIKNNREIVPVAILPVPTSTPTPTASPTA